jgi:hypothetical protein
VVEKYVLPRGIEEFFAPVRAAGRTPTLFVSFSTRRALVRLPLPWNAASRDGLVGIVVNRASGSVSVIPPDPAIAMLLGYLAEGRVPVSDSVLADMATAVLEEKSVSDLRAVAAACALPRKALAERARAPKWREWVDDLVRRAPDLPDIAIIQGWTALLESSSAGAATKALESFLEAHRRGLPLFSAGLRLLLDGLLGMESIAEQSAFAAGYARCLREVRRWATYVDPREPFTTLRLDSPMMENP